MKKWCAAVLTLFLLCSCSSSSSVFSTADQSVNSYSSSGTAAMAENTSVQESTQKIITTAQMNVETKDMDQSVQTFQNLITQYQGTVQSSSSNGDGVYSDGSSYSRNVTYTVRVPAESFDAFMNDCMKLGNVTYTSTQTEDVTDAYIDNDAHLDSLKTQQKKLQELMEQADNVSDLLEIQSQLSDVEAQIESYQNTKDYYDQQTQNSTLDITISQVNSYSSVHSSFWYKFLNSFGSAWQGFLNVLQNIVIFLVYLIPYILLILLIIWIRRYRKKKKAAKSTDSAKKLQ